MRYAEFRDRLEAALREAGLFFPDADRRVETIDLTNTVRSWKVHLWRTTLPSAEPFHVGASISFKWSPVDAARAYTCEEDLLTELVGRRRRPLTTDRRWTRIDLSLHAKLPYGSITSMPEPSVFGAWTAAVMEKADEIFTEIEEKQGHSVGVLGGHEDVQVEADSKPDGVVSLTSILLSGFRMVSVPRVWDDLERRRAEKDPHARAWSTGADVQDRAG